MRNFFVKKKIWNIENSYLLNAVKFLILCAFDFLCQMKEDGSINQDVKSYQIFTDNVYIREISIGCKQRRKNFIYLV